jgi:hypothetical protein
MAEHRATKAGFAAEAQDKMNSKYDVELASNVLMWVKDLLQDDTIETDGSMDSLFDTLKNGQVLCRLANVFQAGVIPEKKISKLASPFKCMENISLFLDVMSKVIGLPAHETFQTVDLWEKQNLTAVLICLQSLARKASKFGLKGMGPKESEANVRQFSDEQMRAGQTVISLQYGTNKGASQTGIVMGNTRHM